MLIYSIVSIFVSIQTLVFCLQVEKEIGERRVLGFTGVGMSVGAELHYKDMTAGCESTEEV